MKKEVQWIRMYVCVSRRKRGSSWHHCSYVDFFFFFLFSRRFCFYSFTLGRPDRCTHVHAHKHTYPRSLSLYLSLTHTHTCTLPYIFPYAQTPKGAFFPHWTIWCRQAHGNNSLKTTHILHLETYHTHTHTQAHRFSLSLSLFQTHTHTHAHTRQLNLLNELLPCSAVH